MVRSRSQFAVVLFAVAGLSSALFAESAPSSPSLQPSSTLSGPSSSGPAPMQALPSGKDILKHEPTWMEGLRFGQKHRLDFGMDFGLDMFHPEGTESSDFNVSYFKLGGNIGYRFAPS